MLPPAQWCERDASKSPWPSRLKFSSKGYDIIAAIGLRQLQHQLHMKHLTVTLDTMNLLAFVSPR